MPLPCNLTIAYVYVILGGPGRSELKGTALIDAS
jgi:hypothetical protein